MNVVAGYASRWLEWTLATSWQLAVLVCLIAVLTYAFRNASPKLRYGLWMLVLVKALLPPTLAAFWGVGAWGVAPVAELGRQTRITMVEPVGSIGELSQAVDRSAHAAPPLASSAIPATSLLFLIWAGGCATLWLVVVWRYRRLVQITAAMRRIDEGPVRIELERLANRLAIHRVPELYATEQAVSPMLIGVLDPKIVLSEPILDRLGTEELRMILAHELVHWRRRDTWVGWLQVFVQGVFWFHPLVWLANARIRHERECACDEAVLREAQCDRDGYGETILRVLTAARGRSLVLANMAGVFERGSHLQTRLEEIMCFDVTRRRFGWQSRASLIAAALVLLPMAAPSVSADPAADAVADDKPQNQIGQGDAVAERSQTNWPVIESTSPAIGATDVDPRTTEISVTFDREMDVSGYSWTGSGPAYPPSPEGAMAVWKDKRTCVLPVQLKRGTYYLVGINSTSFQNFRSAMGVPAETSAIYFVTKGATRGVAARVRVPKVVNSTPEIGDTDVDPRLSLITVTFDVPMDTGGFSWTGSGPQFPTVPAGEKPRWSRDGKTCTLPVTLQPGNQYELGLNSVYHKNFASKWGVPLEPVRFKFATAGTALDHANTPVDPASPPVIVKIVPENGAQDVDPTLTKIEVTFDRPMAASFSWTGSGEHFPSIPEGKKPRWSADKKTCILPVALKPSWPYRLGLNSPSHKNFASAGGVPLEPVVYEFRTSPRNE
jgi:beta-lactamase regulating signal transducer with metallopeptidase domain